MSDLKLVLSAITGAVATAAAFRRDLSDLTARQSLLSQIQQEGARAEEIDKSLRELSKDARSSTGVTRQVLENDRRVTFERLKRLTAEYSRQREDPNYDLSLIQRLFVSFRPESQRAQIVHWLARAFMVLGLISILCWVQVANPGTETEEWIADFALLGCYGTLVFRSWALEERRWSHNYKPSLGVLEAVLLIRGPVDTLVRMAQICVWGSFFWVIEGLEDFVQDVILNKRHNLPVTGELIKIFAPLLALTLCRLYVSTELRPTEPKGPPGRLLSFLRYGGSLVMGICVAELALSLYIAVTGSQLFYEDGREQRGHELAFILQSLLSCVACALWLLRSSQSVKTQVPTKAQAART